MLPMRVLGPPGRALINGWGSTLGLSRRQVLHMVRSLTSKQGQGSTGTYVGGYSASDDPESRKNPLLYQGIFSAQGGASASATPQMPAASEAQQAVSWLIDSPSKPGAVQGLVKPEILAPVGGWPQLKAAVENGADAVYLGLSDFNARARASNFDPEELPEVMTYLHDRGVKGFVTLNVLVFDEELPRVEQRIRQMATAGVDAVIVQDLGVVELMRRVAPGLPVHGSTQMSITSAEGAEFAGALGVERVVVGRELSIKEIAKVRSGSQPEIEAFVHGALCVSYSGQCFSSEAWGGRSANRGQCAQACRLPYGLMVDGVIKDLADANYLLSPQDLAAIEHVPELILAGVSCFKIEGRLKGPEYVALTTHMYRRAVDAAWDVLTGNAAGKSGKTAADSLKQAKAAVALSDTQRWDLQQVFARGQDAQHTGLTPGFLEGVQHQRLVRGRAPRHRGVLAGKVVRVIETRQGSRGASGRQDAGRGGGRATGPGAASSAAVVIEVAAPLKKGDGLVFDAGRPEEREEGGSVYHLLTSQGQVIPSGQVSPVHQSDRQQQPALVAVVFGSGQVDFNKIKPGQLVWRTKDGTLESRLSATYDSLPASQLRKPGVHIRVRGALGEPLTVVMTDEQGRALSHDDVSKAVGAVGGEGFKLLGVDCSDLNLDQSLFMPVSELKSTRRAAAEALLTTRRSHSRDAGLAPSPVLPTLLQSILARPVPAPSQHIQSEMAAEDRMSSAGITAVQAAGRASHLRVLCRSPDQVAAALKVQWLDEVVLDFLEVQGLKEAVAAVRSAGKRVVVATPRILKPDEERLVHFYLRLKADVLLVRSTGLLHQLVALGGPGAPLAIPQLQGDFSLNAANAVTADLLLERGALSQLSPTHDLSAQQICALAKGLGPARAAHQLEVVLHHHLPIFHTEHCVFARFLSSGNSYKDCGHPCEHHRVHLRDDKGQDHLLLADMGCRNTLFNAAAQSGVFYLADLLRAGVRHFRIELVDQPAEVVEPLLQGYRDVMDGHLAPGKLWGEMGTLPDANGRSHGVTPGSLGGLAAQDRSRDSLKPTAASLKHKARS